MQQKCLQCALEGKDMLSEEEREEAKQYARAHGIRIAGKNAYPQFVKYEPNCYPWPLQSAKEQQDLCEALSAAIALSKMLEDKQPGELGLCEIHAKLTTIPLLEKQGDQYTVGKVKLPPEREETYPTPDISNDVAVAKLKKLKKKGVWECQIIRFPEAVQEDPDQMPEFPVVLLAVERAADYMLPVPPVMRYEEQPEELLGLFAEACLDQKVCPKEMKVRDKRTYAFAEAFCNKLKIKMQLEEELPALEAAEEEFFYHFGMNEEEEMEELAGMMEALQNLSKEELAALPPELLRMMEEMTDAIQALGEEEGLSFENVEYEGSFVISVSLGTGCYRHIQISAGDTLFHLHAAILDAFAFDDDHAHAFFMDNRMWSRTDGYYMEGMDDDDRSTMDYRLGQLGLYRGRQFKYVFDFGDEWTFQCKVLKVLNESTPAARVIREKGDAPEQYGMWDGE